MKLFEYQAKEIFAQQGIAIPCGVVADSPEAARRAAEEIGVPCMVKSQLLTAARAFLASYGESDSVHVSVRITPRHE